MGKNKKNGAILLALYAFIALYLVPIFPHGGSANELTRWATTASLIEKGSFEFSWTEPLVGPIVDSAKSGEKIYSNKAPAPAVVSAPFYAMIRIFLGPPDASNIRISWNFLRILIASLPLFLLGFYLWKRGASNFALAAFLFATPLFSYSLLYFSHVFSAILIYAAFRLLFADREHCDSENADVASGEDTGQLPDYNRRAFSAALSLPSYRNAIAGASCGIAVLSEFPAAIAVVVFAVFLAIEKSPGKIKNLLFFIAGGIPFALLLLLYNNALFGSPFSFSYGNEAFGEWAAVANQGILGISFPTPEKLWISFLSPSRGLFFYAPVLALALIVLFRREGRSAIRRKAAIWASIAGLIILAGHGAPHGGWGMSARYSLFVVPLILDAFLSDDGGESNETWRGFLFTASFLLCALPLLSFPFAPPEFAFPHNDFWAAFWIREGWFAPTVLGGSFWALLPLAFAYAGVIGVLLLDSRRLKEFGLGSAAAAAGIAAYLFLPIDSIDSGFRRATIAERFFKPAGRIEPFREEAEKKNDWQSLQKINSAYWYIADARGYAPNDWPYLEAKPPAKSPTALMKNILQMQQRGKTADAENLLKKGREDFPFARCEFSVNLAVIFYGTNRKDLALAELESIRKLPNKSSRPECQRGLMLLGSLYKEYGKNEQASSALAEYLSATELSSDKQVIAERNQAKSLLSK